MINRLFSFMSQGSGTALAVMVVGAMSLHAHDGRADARIGAQAVAADNQGVSMRDVLSDGTKADPLPAIFGTTGHPPSIFGTTGHPPA